MIVFKKIADHYEQHPELVFICLMFFLSLI